MKEIRKSNRPMNSEQSAAERHQENETTSSYLGMTRKEVHPIASEAAASPVTSLLTLVNDKSRDPTAPVEDNAAPFSSALGIPTLIKESERRQRSTDAQKMTGMK